MPPAKATPLKFPPNGANIHTPTPSKPGSPSTHVGPSATSTSTSPPQPESITSPHELTAFVETVLRELENKFDDMSSQILDRMTEMSSRIDSLETSIQELINGDIGSIPGSPVLGTPSSRTQSLRGSTQ